MTGYRTIQLGRFPPVALVIKCPGVFLLVFYRPLTYSALQFLKLLQQRTLPRVRVRQVETTKRMHYENIEDIGDIDGRLRSVLGPGRRNLVRGG
jgi:hypothetical protein